MLPQIVAAISGELLKREKENLEKAYLFRER